MGHPFKITVDVDGDHLRLAVDGEIDTGAASELLDTIKSAVRCDVAGVDLDLSGVTSVDTAGLDVLIEGERAARNCDSAFGYRCHLRILRPSRAVEVALWAAGLDGYLEIAEGSDRQPAA
jgi:anti-anti-sigma factor